MAKIGGLSSLNNEFVVSAISGLEAALLRFFLSMSSPRPLCSDQDHADSGLLQQHCGPLRLLDSVTAKQELCRLRLSLLPQDSM